MMRTLVALVLAVIVAVGSPAGIVAQQPEASTAPVASTEPAAPRDFTVPGYYPVDEFETNYRYYDGQEWSGPVVDSTVVGVHVALLSIGIKPETLEYLALILGGGGEGLYVAIIVLALTVLGRVGAGNAAPSPSPAPLVSPSPTPPPSPGQSPASETAVSLSSNYRFVWSWGATIGGFDGTVSGDAGGWRYTGASISSWPPGLHAEGGTASCTFEGDPEVAMPEGGWPMDCDIYWRGDATWAGVITGRFYPIGDKSDATTDFEFKGTGQGTDGGDWSPIEVLLKPCEPDAVC